MKGLLSRKFLRNTCAFVVIFLHVNTHAQVVGGHLNNEPTPKVAEAGKLVGGGYAGDVNLFNGTYSANIPLGTVSTPSGLSYTLNHSYSGSHTTGGVPEICKGIPYGEGWQVDLPSITVETDEYHKFSVAREQLENNPNHTNDTMKYSISDGIKENEIYWYNVHVNIPGVASGRAIFKHIDDKDNDCAVFVLNKFEQSIEIRFHGSFWTITAPNGDIYEFYTNLAPYNNASNRRVIYFDQNASGSGTVNNMFDVVFNGKYNNSPAADYRQAVLNVIEPKMSFSTWYCDRISNRNIPYQGIVFHYNYYGAFNYFKEFQQINMPWAFHQRLGNATLPYTHDYTSYRDILLRKVSSYVLETPLDIIDLEYETDFSVLATSGNRMVNYTQEGSGRIDSLYSYKNLLHNGESISDFQNWSRYEHQSLVGGIPNASNPYISGSSYRKSSISNMDEIPFSHSFLASPRLLTVNDFVPGDIYEIRTKVKRNSSGSLENGNGLLDIKIVSGTRGYTQDNVNSHYAAPNLGNGNISIGEFEKYNGIELFSTHNRAIKWSITHNTSSVTTSNYFVLPNIPSYFGGLSIQIGPANSDHNFSIDNLINGTEIPNGYNTYHHMNQGPNTPKSASTLPHSFGVGMPWSLVLPIYQHKMTGGLLGQINEQGQIIPNSVSIYNFWANGTSNSDWENKPTKFDDDVKLSEVQLLRYSKNPYMLKSVKQYRINGEYNGNSSQAEEDTSHVLLSHKSFEYHAVLDDVFENFNYANNEPILVSNSYKQVKVYLSKVREMPVNDEFVDIPAQLDTAEIPTTFLSYSDYSEIPQTFQDTLVLGVKVRVLTSFVDHLGGHTRIHYYPITHNATYSQHNYSVHWSGIADLGVAQRYGLDKAFTIFPAVHELIKWDEKNLDISNTTISGHKKWTYLYDTENPRLAAMTSPSTNLPNFRYRNNSQQTYRGFAKTTVFDPPDNNGNRSYSEYNFYGAKLGTTVGLMDYLLIGKLKERKSFSHNGQIQNETLFEYDYTRAFVNGRDRPNLIKDAPYYEIMMGESEYRDWYKEDYFAAQDANGNVVTGYEAQTYIYNPHFNGQGSYLKRPKFLEFHFYEDLLTINPSYLFNSYFVKKVKERSRTYENQLAKSMTLQPVVLPWVYGENGTFVDDIPNDTECDWRLKKHILEPLSSSKNYLLSQGKMGDSLLVLMINSGKWSSSDQRQILINQNGLSLIVWKEIFKTMSKYKPSDLLQILNFQPVVITPIQYAALNNIDKRPSDEFLECVFLKNDYLQDTILSLILDNASKLPRNLVDSIFVQQPQLSNQVLAEFIKSKYVSRTLKKEVLSKNVLSENHYQNIISHFKDHEVEYIVLSSPSYPSDSILSSIIDKNFDEKIIISIFHASPREFSEWLIKKVKNRFGLLLADIILRPVLNLNGLKQFCNNALLTGRTYIDNITEYSYYEANERGKTLSDGFIDLLGMQDVPGRQVTFNGYTKTIDSLQLKHEPSWQVYSVKKYSPQLPGAFSQEKYYYYYDLLNRYDRWWFMYDGENGMRSEPYITDFLGIDTITNVFTWSEDYNFGWLPQIDGMIKSREHNLKTIPFQNTIVSKNNTDEFALNRSTYYDYDARWFPDDFTSQQVIDYEGETCPDIVINDPCERIYDCTPCMLYKYTAPHVEETDLPYGFCSYTDLGGNTYFCPSNLDVTPWFGNDYVTNLCKDGYENVDGGNRAQIPQQVISKTLQLRSVYTQLDTLKYESGLIGYLPNNSSELDEKNAFFRLKIDSNNNDIVEFWMGAPDEMDENNRLPYRMILPYDALRTTHIHQRNRYLQPTITENSIGLKTRYYYNNAQHYFYRNTNCLTGLGSYTATLNTDIGLPIRVTVGYDRADSMSTTFAYSRAGMVKETVSPNHKKMNFTFDIYNRLYEVREAETRLLSQNLYHYWDHNQTLNFEERAQMNYVMSTIFSDENKREWKKAFVDPLGRDFGAISAVDSQQKQVHSGALVYDNLGRVIEAHKPHYLESAQFLSVKNYNVPSMQTVYENSPKSRVLRTYDFGVDQNSTHFSGNKFHITNNVYTACELDLSSKEISLLFGTGNSSALRFYRNESHDQDGKKTISYTNAIGQQIATLRYVGLDEKVKTLFAYDSYGNLTKTINANQQETDYNYNILGQLYLETTVDAGNKRYMYNKQGQVSAVQDEIARAHKDENNEPAPYYRKFEFDDYGRILGVKRVYYNPYHDAFRYSDGWIHNGNDEPVQDANGNWNYLKYSFSNSMTLDWLGDYSTFAWVVGPSGGEFPGNTTLSGLPDGGSAYEKRWTYGTDSESYDLGQLKDVESFDNNGWPNQGTQYPVQKINYSYNDLEQIEQENISFNPTGLGGSNDPLLTVESSIMYAEYNYRGTLLKKQVDVNGDDVIDLTYFNIVDDWNRLRDVYVALGDAQDVSQASKVATYDYNDALGHITNKHYYAYNHLINEDDAFHQTTYTYDMRDRLVRANSNLMDYRLYYDNQLVGPDNWGEPIMQGFNHNGNINGVSVNYNWTHTDMPAVAQMEEQLLYGYTYDKLNRLIRADATVGDYVTDQQHANIHDFYRIGDVNYKYDHIGNLMQTARILPETYANNALAVQELNYGYQNDRNRLQNVYKPGLYNRSFTYDLSGNLLTDSEKGITHTDYGRAAYPFALNVTNPLTSEQFHHSYLYDAGDLRIFKGTVSGSSANNRMEYYLKDIAVYDMTTNTWTYYVSTNERIAKVTPTLAQTPGDNGSNTSISLGLSQVSFYETDHLGNNRVVFSPRNFLSNGDVIKTIHFAADYYPYGKTLRFFETAAFEEKFLTTQHERDRETGFDYRGARYYDADLGRFLSLDPLAAKFPAWSAYNYVLGNPISLIDPDGKAPIPPDDYIFNEKGEFVRIDQNKQPDRLVIENSQTGSRRDYWFADPKEDPQQIREGIINKVVFVSKSQIEGMLLKQGAFNPENKDSWINFYKESKGGQNFDYSYSVIPTEFATQGASYNPLQTPSPMLFIPEGDYLAHNHMNFGNFLWAASGYTLGFSYSVLQLAAHANSLMNSGSNGYESQLDSEDDQKSIKKGAYYADKNKFRLILEKVIEDIKNQNQR